ncbi:2Fe-2S iron-sulfur cluster-binding protein [Natrialbaceae archaeon AArc-T1-2]|uniref:2Fe-2S iron-sulfur cluster-binding protein n=1 Tax=Natrialbaceae archaeon AArc-T1-2 TaxID=3053904 RepID=UPI00255B36E0|nr:2Fe-2S iron-sulfur cluster-binding protein [Natrialbaceae archaeon AArc-T1-2]WIV67299.1 2Fe-2S iron-sulfur cluster-binding protein [Natrialbaceae archaeon AArc-T1-2]
METYTVELEVPDDADVDAAGETVTFEVGPDEYLLPAARAEGVWLEADCQQGWCTRCAARLLEGDVDQGDAKRYYDVDEAEGFVLTCRAKPRSDLRLRAFKYDEILEHRAAHDLPPGRSKR